MQSQSATGPGRRQKRWQVRGSFGGRRPGGGRLAASGRKFWLLQAKPAAHIDFQLGDSPWLRPSWLGELRQLSQCSRPSSRSLGERRGPPLEAPGVPDYQGCEYCTGSPSWLWTEAVSVGGHGDTPCLPLNRCRTWMMTKESPQTGLSEI